MKTAVEGGDDEEKILAAIEDGLRKLTEKHGEMASAMVGIAASTIGPIGERLKFVTDMLKLEVEKGDEATAR